MATYKKRGGKPKKEKIDSLDPQFNQVGEEAIDVSDSTTAEVFDALDETANKSEQWIEKNSKVLVSILVACLVLFLGYLAYQRFVSEPKELKSSNQLAYPRVNFDKAEKATNQKEADSLYNLALTEGISGKMGFVDIASEYSGTKAGNLANYYAGISYYKLKNYEKSKEYLEKFDSNDDNLGPVAMGTVGDVFADLEQYDDAIKYYEKAANMKDNSFTTPLYLFKAGQLALASKKFEVAKKYFTTIKEKYTSVGGGQEQYKREIDTYINMAKYGDASAVANSAEVVGTPVEKVSDPKQEVIEDVNALYNTSAEFVGKTVKGYEYLGEFVSLKLKDESELIVLSKGFESGLLNFIKSDAEADKTTWFNLRRVLFKTGKADLDDKSNNQIDNVVRILKAYPNVSLKLGGYTDNTGNADFNKKLSDRRAKAVLNAMVSKGIAKERLAAEGYGIEFPAADNNTDAGRTLNRRVAARVSKK